MKAFFSFAKWVPVGVAATVTINAHIAALSTGSTLTPLWLFFGCSVALSAFFWHLERDFAVYRDHYGIGLPVDLLHFAGAIIIASTVLALA